MCLFLCPESTDEEVDKLHCLNHSGSSATYSDYSPSQGSSGSSNPPGNTHSHTLSHGHPHNPALPAPSKDQAPQTHWTNRCTRLFHDRFHQCPSLPLSIISCSLSIPHPLQFPPSVIHHIRLSVTPSSLSVSIDLCLSHLSARSVKVREAHRDAAGFSSGFSFSASKLQSCYYPEDFFFNPDTLEKKKACSAS